MAQAQRKASGEPLVKLRVVAHKYMESVTKMGKAKIVTAPWANNTVLFNKKRYGPGETFEVPAKQAEALLDTGSVQKASEKPKPFRPPSLDHDISLTDGIVLREDVEGKVPTRNGEADKDAPWEDDDYEAGY